MQVLFLGPSCLRLHRECESSAQVSFSRRDFRQLLWPLAIAGLIILASSRSRVASPDIGGIDKVAHFLVYGLLGTLVCRLRPGWRAAVWALVITSAFGVSDEFHQRFVPGRTSAVDDWIADTLGAAIAIALYVGCAPYRRLLEMRLCRRRKA
jgi:VanZ family protein